MLVLWFFFKIESLDLEVEIWRHIIPVHVVKLITPFNIFRWWWTKVIRLSLKRTIFNRRWRAPISTLAQLSKILLHRIISYKRLIDFRIFFFSRIFIYIYIFVSRYPFHGYSISYSTRNRSVLFQHGTAATSFGCSI